MRRGLSAAAVALVLVLAPFAALPADAGPAVVERRSVSFEAAMEIARASLAEAEAQKCVSAVVVVDDSALPLVLLRQDGATEQFVTGATRKAWTAVNLRASTRDLLATVKAGVEDDGQLPHVRNALFLMGGVPLRDGDAIVGAVGTAGCVEGLGDDAVARAGAAAFEKLAAGADAE
ncbi:MAG: heme-binding protein [Bauldia sp.]|nr:heme-binding protein [Bauldia sp.]